MDNTFVQTLLEYEKKLRERATELQMNTKKRRMIKIDKKKADKIQYSLGRIHETLDRLDEKSFTPTIRELERNDIIHYNDGLELRTAFYTLLAYSRDAYYNTVEDLLLSAENDALLSPLSYNYEVIRRIDESLANAVNSSRKLRRKLRKTEREIRQKFSLT